MERDCPRNPSEFFAQRALANHPGCPRCMLRLRRRADVSQSGPQFSSEGSMTQKPNNTRQQTPGVHLAAYLFSSARRGCAGR
jgi:hypothetical protein